MGKRLDVNKEGVAGAKPGLAIGGQPPARDEVMDVGMITQVAGPGLQDAQQANLTADKAGVLGEFLQGRGGGLKQQVINQALVTAGYRS